MKTPVPLAHVLGRMLIVCGLVLGLVGCGGHYPADPDGTLNRISGTTLRVGVSHQPPWTDTGEEHSPDEPGGIEAQLIADYAASIDAEVEWHAGGEEHLIKLLSERELDVVIGGLTDQSPWSSDAGLTTSYAESLGVDGKTTKHVMAVQMGENAFMTSLERFLLDQDIDQQVPEEMRP
ncbi:MAG TPA: ABC transporter substrate-binding protein [Enteractinococcus helveticum]|uniref:ABC transporter substrate-binding protein n=1 Tax=Enteractinococcus helveticum TaxID=1837282 RepID=A0A921K965_9MICC|nr:ABC transporter substrate-binding protein [Enteractinococcus helveticum]HJF15966.1 ABC transporter substrate-binding protein [Enteractinococcus helveticum]